MDFVPWKKLDAQTGNPQTNSGAPLFFRQILAARGLDAPQPADSGDPFLLPDMDKAAERIHMAISAGQRILVYGDYDCDGVTATVMLYDYLENAGADVLYYIPQREGEGYGLNLDAVERIHQAEVNLIITVDNGISSLDEIAKAMGYGIDVIVTDHHQPKETLPDCVAVVDPHRADCQYPFRDLCGAGVAYKLICALENDTEGLMLELYGDLLAVATMADIVPLRGENRELVRAGLEVLANTQRPGLTALAAVAGIELSTVTGEQISFGLAPRINVTGRIASVDLAVELLLTQDEDEALHLASDINDLNTKRKEIEAEIVAEIGQQLAEHPALTAARVLVVCGDGWNPGVIGITAARLVERYRKPVIVFSRMENGELRGSARSVEGYSIIESIHACGAYLVKYGGHPMAAGLTVTAERFPDFVAALQQESAQRHPTMPRSCLSVDCDLTIADITLDNIKLLDTLQPFGCDNPQPVLALRGVTVGAVTPMGGGNHLRLTLTSGGVQTEAVYFSMTQAGFPFPVGTVVDCAVSLSVNVWQGAEKPSVRVVGMVPVGFPMEEKLRGQELYDSLRRGEPLPEPERAHCAFGRDDLSAVFRLLRGLSPYGGGSDWLLHRLGGDFGGFRLLSALDILCELGLIHAERQKTGIVYTVVPTASKANIADASTYKKLAAGALTRA